ncbi:antibiotic biosynthesis monooxygenase [Listeria monocytogenes]|uniref:putative quinol monooxygenase n=1 Tax=Listeria monocytogenes TaxID=1639 RepID=UPI000874F678|nr:putative quinol monooxygenase [Listeria monocytogenes]EAF4456819.1 antibiotic biosynthesis monooxygenase [Listeria monocytogenes serotype 1/2a]EAC7102993.1 antibiotic biosynthesis monooxygenase [Listeria monocytogenes]EAD0069853.1 antibiotic biosynthesis monooxygenase [Listeria monocytogenes]EAD0585785.1 antibiotic biosynthesis monooxygenase [Listeria monocytogenes]EAE9230499.1 antibiotic biosynthesis monooxygenase [Listeria monocytogenes]
MKVGYGLLTAFYTHPGEKDNLVKILLEAAEALADYNTCIQYIISESETEADTVFVSEIWIDKGHHAASLDNLAVQETIARAKPMIKEIKQIQELDILGGKGV